MPGLMNDPKFLEMIRQPMDEYSIARASTEPNMEELALNYAPMGMMRVVGPQYLNSATRQALYEKYKDLIDSLITSGKDKYKTVSIGGSFAEPGIVNPRDLDVFAEVAKGNPTGTFRGSGVHVFENTPQQNLYSLRYGQSKYGPKHNWIQIHPELP